MPARHVAGLFLKDGEGIIPPGEELLLPMYPIFDYDSCLKDAQPDQAHHEKSNIQEVHVFEAFHQSIMFSPRNLNQCAFVGLECTTLKQENRFSVG